MKLAVQKFNTSKSFFGVVVMTMKPKDQYVLVAPCVDGCARVVIIDVCVNAAVKLYKLDNG